MTLADWLDEYRHLSVDDFRRPVAEEEEEADDTFLAPADRVRDTSPRWLARAERIGYGRPTQI